jgi:hypothetical protein
MGRKLHKAESVRKRRDKTFEKPVGTDKNIYRK